MFILKLLIYIFPLKSFYYLHISFSLVNKFKNLLSIVCKENSLIIIAKFCCNFVFTKIKILKLSILTLKYIEIISFLVFYCRLLNQLSSNFNTFNTYLGIFVFISTFVLKLKEQTNYKLIIALSQLRLLLHNMHLFY